jgi:hypothetical protein
VSVGSGLRVLRFPDVKVKAVEWAGELRTDRYYERRGGVEHNPN